jgi:uncharacterized protein (UPF0548 family)
MFWLRKPDSKALERIRAHYQGATVSYTEVGCSAADAAAGYTVDTYRARLGSGRVVYQSARRAIADWRMLRLGWVQPCWPSAPVEPGALVGTLTRLFGLWTVNVCRIVQVIDDDGPVSRYGLAYGTLPGHAECGEERFMVEWQRDNDSVWYEIRAVSKPGRWLTWVGYPLTRRIQRRFGRDSLRSMVEAVSA